MAKVTIIAAARCPPPTADPAAALVRDAHWIEARADLIPNVAPGLFRDHSPAQLIYTLRSQEEGGQFSGGERERGRSILRAASEGYDLITLEAERDLNAVVLSAIPPWRRLITWRGKIDSSADLRRRLASVSTVGARLYRFETIVNQVSDGLIPLLFLHDLRRADVTAFALGREGLWTRLIAPRFGAPVVHGNLDTFPDPFAAPTIYSLLNDYGLPELRPVTELFGIIGSHLDGSLSPCLHNRAYGALKLEKLYLPFHAESLRDFWAQVVVPKLFARIGLSLGGLTVTSPHKETVLELASPGSKVVARARSSNAVFMRDGVWVADTADCQGVLAPLRERGVALTGRKAAVVGCGGSGRAMAAALDQAGAKVTLVNRGRERGRLAVRLLGLPFVPLVQFQPAGFDLVVNATPLGREGEPSPFDVTQLRQSAVIVDLAYGSRPTPLVTHARALGRTAIDGREVLLSQVFHQFWLMTGREMPRPLAREAVGWPTDGTVGPAPLHAEAVADGKA